MPEYKVEKEPGLLPVVQMQGREFVVDVENREFRDVNDPKNTVDMHSDEGRRMVREMAGTEWQVYRVVRVAGASIGGVSNKSKDDTFYGGSTAVC